MALTELFDNAMVSAFMVLLDTDGYFQGTNKGEVMVTSMTVISIGIKSFSKTSPHISIEVLLIEPGTVATCKQKCGKVGMGCNVRLTPVFVNENASVVLGRTILQHVDCSMPCSPKVGSSSQSF